MELILIRGVPGSGKSTLARTAFAGYRHLEADQYFVRENGLYVYDASAIGLAHAWCQEQTRLALNSGISVVVSNTFTRVSELSAYLCLGVPTHVFVAQGEYANTHGVPDQIVLAMKARWEPYPGEVYVPPGFLP